MTKQLFNIIRLWLFTGSVFFTSGKFVNATNTPKFYFVATTLLAVAAITATCKKRVTFGVLSSKSILWSINIICFIQACYGFSQFIGWLQPNNFNFKVTGSFDNPAGFAAVLSIGFPAGVFPFTKSGQIGKYFAAVIFR